MALETKYELLYRKQDDVCGDPFAEFMAFAESYPNSSASVLDLGCGQGRDAIVFARQGLTVTGVDISPTGIEQMIAFGRSNNLRITGVVADIRDYDTDLRFDIIILDRTLHMLTNSSDRLDVIARCADWLALGGHMLIADERSNIPAFADWFVRDSRDWQLTPKMKPGFCFARLLDGYPNVTQNVG